MTKNDLINDIVTILLPTFTNEQLEIIKSTFIVKMQGFDIHEVCTLPSTEVMDNLYIFKRFSVDMLAKYQNISHIYSSVLCLLQQEFQRS